ncbi:hypothetical protein [Thermococcus sp.]
MRLKFERLEFEIPSSAVLMGHTIIYFATSSLGCGVLRNLRIFGLRDRYCQDNL